MAIDTTPYRVKLREERNARILHSHKAGDTSLQIAKRLGITSGAVNKVLRDAGLEPHYPYEGLTVITGGRKGAAVKRNSS